MKATKEHQLAIAKRLFDRGLYASVEITADVIATPGADLPPRLQYKARVYAQSDRYGSASASHTSLEPITVGELMPLEAKVLSDLGLKIKEVA